VNIRLPWLGVVGVFLVTIGLVLGFARWSRAYPGLIILAGCVALAVFLMVNEVTATRPDRKVREASTSTP
jgi:hypothetical protein